MLCLRSFSSTVPFLSTLVLPFLCVGEAPAASAAASPLTVPSRPAGLTTSVVEERAVFPGRLYPGQNCTIVYVADDGVALAGNNEDWTGLFAEIHFLPASDGKYGRVYFGFDVAHNPQGGMNDQGLFFDGASAEQVQVPRDPSKPDPGHDVCSIIKAMEECSTVDEVLEYLGPYDCSRYRSGHFLIGDRFGNSAIIEPGTVIKKTDGYQVVTNFLQSRTPPETSRDPRYRLAAKLLEESDDCSVDLVRRVLSATHWEEYSGSMTVTLYSYICDLKHGEIYVYNFHDFEEVVKINLREELAKGERVCTIASLFPYETFAERRYKAWRIVDLLYERAVQNGLDGPEGTIAYYQQLCSGEDESTRYEVHETQLLAAGYRLLEDGRNELAIGIFEFNVSEHPESAQGYYCLAEAYATAGENELAIQSCEKSLALDPRNDNARRMLEDLRR